MQHARAVVLELEQVAREVEVLVGVVALAHALDGQPERLGGQAAPRGDPMHDVDLADRPSCAPTSPTSACSTRSPPSRASASCPPRLRDRAYENRALAIGCGQTISQPLVVARMTRAAGAAPRATACSTSAPARATTPRCSRRLARHVWSIERHARLSRRAARNLAAAGVHERHARRRRRHARAARERAVRRDQRRRRGQRRGRSPSSRTSSRPAGASSRRSTEPLQRLSLTRRTPAGPRARAARGGALRAAGARRVTLARRTAAAGAPSAAARPRWRPPRARPGARAERALGVVEQPPGSARRSRPGAPRARCGSRRRSLRSEGHGAKATPRAGAGQASAPARRGRRARRRARRTSAASKVRSSGVLRRARPRPRSPASRPSGAAIARSE